MKILSELKPGGLSASNSREEILFYHEDAEIFKQRFPKREHEYSYLMESKNNIIRYVYQYDPPSGWSSSDFLLSRK